MNILFGDTETYCETPIANGHHRYAEEAEVLMHSWAWNDDPADVADWTADPRAADRFQNDLDYADQIVFHNAPFDLTVLKHRGFQIDINKVHCTMVQALAHSLPGSLADLCRIFKLPADLAKDKRGKQLIQLFCKPQPINRKIRRATRFTHPAEWAEFLAYAKQDIPSMRALRKRMPKWNLSPRERDLWLLDQKVNNRGFKVDVELAEAALAAADRAKARLAKEVHAKTDGALASTTQRAKALEHLQTLGVELSDLRGGTVTKLLEDHKEAIKRGEPGLPEEAVDILENRSEAAATSPAKYKTLQGAVSVDHRLRGTIQFCGASRTGRDAGRIFQPQNLPRPTLKAHVIDNGIAAIKAGVEDLITDKVMTLCANAVRGCIVTEPGNKLVIADLSNIEGRVLAWLADEQWKLDAFRLYDTFLLDRFGQRIPDPKKKGEFLRAGPDLYKVTAGGIVGKHPDDVTDDERQKQGKVPELACGFQGALGAFTVMGANYGVYLPDEEVLAIVHGWRKKHPKTVNLWYDAERAAIAAVREPGKAFMAGKKLAFRCDGVWLRMQLPSIVDGRPRFLCYPDPKVSEVGDACPKCAGEGELRIVDPKASVSDQDPPTILIVCPDCEGSGLDRPDKLTYMGVNQYTRKWERLKTYGGKLIENATQATARDVLGAGSLRAEAAGYGIVLRVHDELLTETPDDPRWNVDELAMLMATNDDWNEGLPLAAAGFETYRYRKG